MNYFEVFELPQAGRGSRGKPMVNLLPLEEGEKINAILPIKQFDDDRCRTEPAPPLAGAVRTR